MKKRYTITINLELDNPDYIAWCEKQNLIEDIAERLGCSESNIEVEEDDIDNDIENNEH